MIDIFNLTISKDSATYLKDKRRCREVDVFSKTDLDNLAALDGKVLKLKETNENVITAKLSYDVKKTIKLNDNAYEVQYWLYLI